MKYVLKRTKDGKYVAIGGLESSYTNNLRYAQIFPSKKHAIASKCENEYPVSVDGELLGDTSCYRQNSSRK
jgi:hypothetical protein